MEVKVNGMRPTSASPISSSLGGGELCSQYSWDIWIQACLGMSGVETVSLDKENGLWESRRESPIWLWWGFKARSLRSGDANANGGGKWGSSYRAAAKYICLPQEVWNHIQSQKKKKNNLLFDSVMLLLGIYLAKRIKYVCILFSSMEDNRDITDKSKTLKLI